MSMQFEHDTEVDDFLAALSLIDEKSALKLKEELNKKLESNINWDVTLNDEKHANIGQIMQAHNVILAAHLKLYHDGLSSAIAALLSHCGSVTYTIDLFNGYIGGLGDTYGDYGANTSFFKNCYDDSIYDDYFTAIHKGLFNIASLRHPDYDPDYIQFTKLKLLPLKQSNSVIGIKFLFKFGGDNVRTVDDYIDIGVEFKSMIKGIIIQMTQLMNREIVYKRKYHEFVQIESNGSICFLDEILRNIEPNDQ
jgi:hypothetical protein